MNNENTHPTLKEPPLAHALHRWDDAAKTLAYEYNGVDILSIDLSKAENPGYRHGSDGTLQSGQYMQQLYLMVEKPVWCTLHFTLGADAWNMRPHRAQVGQAILGQTGRPLLPGVNALYDAGQDLLVDWNGCEWRWNEAGVQEENGQCRASIQVLLCEKPLFINLRMHFYRRHLGYGHHQPWKWRPNPRPVAGWCSWEAWRRDINQEKIARAARFFADTLLPYGLDIIQVDDGYQKMPLPYDGALDMAGGWMACDARKFPRGHAGIVEAIEDAGMTPGIWTNANITNPDFPQKHPEDVLWHGGRPMKGEWIDYLYSCLPGTLASQVRPIFERYRQAGYKYLKIDAIRHLLLDGLHEAVRLGEMTNDEAERRFRAYMAATREGLGDEVYYLASWGEMHEVVGVADACRISMDANPTWAGVRMQLFETARWFHTQRVLFLNDPDHVCARTRPEWAKSVLSLCSLSGGLYMLSDQPEDYTPEKLEIIRKTLPPLPTRTAETGPLDVRFPAYTWTKLHGFAVQSSEKPVTAEDVHLKDALDMAGEYPTMHEAHPFSCLWGFHLSGVLRAWCVMLRVATVPLKASDVPLEALGLDPGQSYHAYDFWARKYLGRVSGALKAVPLALGECQVVAFHAVARGPQLIASTRHVSMDAVSVAGHRWKDGRLRLKLCGVPGTTESYIIHTNGYRVRGGSCKGAEMVTESVDGLVEATLHFTRADCVLELPFEQADSSGRKEGRP